ncbi:hypothetical protein GWI33_021417 [Rhynchophorus ferrugineus]|uniref:Uncharacterized protein n=1 Tax=Rhynchophorus ferrugineus TaxID=354439 RepID=A0A834M390_RHYFE|nr:hypothetical protein GWI33_021417 [Rhynchophorus ferrugineus]
MLETFDENKTKTDNRSGQMQGSGVGHTTTGLIRDLDITQGCDHFGKLKYDYLVAMADIKHFEFSMETVKKKCLLGRESA